MPTDFLQNLMIGMQMGQQRRDAQRRDQLMQLEAQQEARRQQQSAIDAQMRQDALKLQKQRLDWELKNEQFKAKAEAAAQLSKQQQIAPPEAMNLGGGGPNDSVGQLALGPAVRQRAPIMAEIPGAEDMGPVELPMYEDIQARKQEELQQRMREALGMKIGEARALEPFKIADDERAAALARERDAATASRAEAAAVRAEGRATAKETAAKAKEGDFGIAKSEGERKAVSAAQFALEKMPEWESYVDQNPDVFGPVAGRVTQLQQTGLGRALGIKPSAEVAKRQAQFAVMRNGMINALSGAAVSPAEFERLKQQIPELTDDPVVVKEKLKVLGDYFAGNLQRFQAKTPGGIAQPGGSRARVINGVTVEEVAP